MKTRKNFKTWNLEIEWSSEHWAPLIQVRSGRTGSDAECALYDPFSFVPEKPRKRKQPVSVLWVRSGTRSSWR